MYWTVHLAKDIKKMKKVSISFSINNGIEYTISWSEEAYN